MIRQYYAQRSRGGDNPLRVGIIPTGAIFYLQAEGWWRDRFRGAPICRNPWIVEGFLNGVLCAARRNRDADRWEDVYMARRSDMAIVRSLRDGRRRHVAIRTLIHHEDEGLRRDPATYPDLPKVRVTRPISSPVIRPSKPWKRPVLGVATVGNGAVVERTADNKMMMIHDHHL
jgi:hypothetical protein